MDADCLCGKPAVLSGVRYVDRREVAGIRGMRYCVKAVTCTGGSLFLR